ncbi:MAG TPA: PucR family transcriptional regulator ligand-binding domain-containing protein [Streptosporangiales bacterium]
MPTVAEVLELDALRRARPSVLAGSRALCRKVRWLRVGELPDAVRTLRDGELVLTAGAAVPTDRRAQLACVADLAAAGAAGLLVALGPRHRRSLPGSMAGAAERHGLPLVGLSRQVHVVDVAEAVHSRIITGQVEKLHAAEQLHAIFTELSLEGATVTRIVREAARLSGVPVVLEDLSHRVVAFDSPTDAVQDVLTGWEQRSRATVSTGRHTYHAATGLLCARLAARGEEWGRLVLVCADPPTTRQRMVAERAATTVALTHLIEREHDSLARHAERSLLNAIVEHRYDDAQLASRAGALGIPLTGRRLLGVTIRPPRAWLAAGAELSEAVLQAAGRAHAAALVGSLDEHTVSTLLSLPPEADEDRALSRLAQAMWEHNAAWAHGAPVERPAIGVGFATTDLDGARRSLVESHHVASSVSPTIDGPRYRRMADLGVRGLLHLLRDDGRLHSYVEQQIGPLLRITAHDDRLFRTLSAYLAAGGNKKAAAAATHLSRAGFYERLARIEDVLVTDLDDPERRLSLHLAVVAAEEFRTSDKSARLPVTAPRTGYAQRHTAVRTSESA